MCGICGQFIFNNIQDGNSTNLIQEMLANLESRGPDSEGYLSYKSLDMGHRRLATVDISNFSSQPMSDSLLGMDVVFNGCILNYKELRQKLIKFGYNFTSSSDTEVIIKSHHKWGINAPKHFHGMFAYAIFDRNTSRLHLVRDRFGIKPLYYYYVSGEKIIFSSNTKSITNSVPKQFNIDKDSISHYMTLNSIVPVPSTLIKEIKKIPPASVVTYDNYGGVNTSKYWSIDNLGETIDEDIDLRVEQAIVKSVERWLTADVEIGVLLSGGIDSSLIVAIMNFLGHENIKTYSVGFDKEGEHLGHEFEYSDYIAEIFKTKHTKISINRNNILSRIDDLFDAMSEPMVSFDCIGFLYLGEEVSHDLKIVLSGQGADEVFAGYHWYQNIENTQNVHEKYSKVFFDRSDSQLKKCLNNDWYSGFISYDLVGDFLTQKKHVKNSLDKVMQLDMEIMMPDDPLKRLDNMLMASGVEGRVPFLDHELVELLSKIPAFHKVKNNGKGILKDISYKYLPEHIVNRKKEYFPVPALKYLNGDILEMARDIMTSKKARDRGIFNENYIKKLLDEPNKNITPLQSSELWQCMSLELWIQKNML